MKKIIRIMCLALLMAASPLFIRNAFAETCECGAEMSQTYIPTASPPTCTEGGVIAYVCPACGNVHSYESGPLGHSYDRLVVEEPTCEEYGLVGYVCNRCKDQYQDEISPLGHDMREYVEAEPTCEEGGFATYECSRCDYSDEGELPPLGHLFIKEETPATCTEDGKIVYKCSRCFSQHEQIIKAEGHKFETTVDKAPTCTGEGEHTGVCTVCKETVTEKEPAKGHKYKYETVEPKCTENGEKTGVCPVCGDETKEILTAAGHKFGDWMTVLEPTLLKEGSAERSCSVCGEKESKILPQLKPDGKTIAAAAAVVILGGCGAAFFGLRGSAARKAAKAAKAARSAKVRGGGSASLKMSKVMSCLAETEENLAFEELLKEKTYVDLKKPGERNTDEEGKPEKPEMVLFSAENNDELRTGIERINAEYPNAHVGAVAGEGVTEELLAWLMENETLFAFARSSDSQTRKMVRLIMPLFKPSQAGGFYAENATMITEAMGLPVLTAILNTYVVGGDVKEAIQNRGMGSADIADMINDVAGMFGLDGLANIAEAARVGSDQQERISDKHKAKVKII